MTEDVKQQKTETAEFDDELSDEALDRTAGGDDSFCAWNCRLH